MIIIIIFNWVRIAIALGEKFDDLLSLLIKSATTIPKGFIKA